MKKWEIDSWPEISSETDRIPFSKEKDAYHRYLSVYSRIIQTYSQDIKESLDVLGKEVMAQRVSRKLEVEEAAQKMGYHLAFIWLLESGQLLLEEIRPQVLRKICLALGFSEYFLEKKYWYLVKEAERSKK